MARGATGIGDRKWRRRRFIQSPRLWPLVPGFNDYDLMYG